jgi:hypothetical protein
MQLRLHFTITVDAAFVNSDFLSFVFYFVKVSTQAQISMVFSVFSSTAFCNVG